MCLRWTAAGMLEAERQFRSIIQSEDASYRGEEPAIALHSTETRVEYFDRAEALAAAGLGDRRGRLDPGRVERLKGPTRLDLARE
jgi:hypothetical protein